MQANKRAALALAAGLIASPAWAASPYETFVLANNSNVTNLWGFVSDASNSVGGGAALACTGGCSYGVQVTASVTGVQLDTSQNSYLTASQQWSNPCCISAFALEYVVVYPVAPTHPLVFQWSNSGTLLNTVSMYFDACYAAPHEVITILTDQSASQVGCNGSPLNDGNAHHVVLSCVNPGSSSSCKTYVDGSLADTITGFNWNAGFTASATQYIGNYTPLQQSHVAEAPIGAIVWYTCGAGTTPCLTDAQIAADAGCALHGIGCSGTGQSYLLDSRSDTVSYLIH